MKTKNNNIQTEKKDTKSTKKKSNRIVDQYYDLLIMKMRPVSEAYLERLASDYINFFKENKDEFHKIAFQLHIGMDRGTFYDWIKRYEIFRRADDYVEAYLFNKVHKGSLKKELEPTISRITMSSFSKEWKQEEEDRSSKRNDTTPVTFMIKPVEVKDQKDE